MSKKVNESRSLLNIDSRSFLTIGCDIGTMEVLIESSNVDVKSARRSTNPQNTRYSVHEPVHFVSKLTVFSNKIMPQLLLR